MSTIEELTERGVSLAEQIADLEERYGSDADLWPAGVRTRHENLHRGLKATDTDLRALEAAGQRNETLRQYAISHPEVRESGFGGGTPTRSRANPWRGLGDNLLGESPAGYAQRALDAIELLPGIPTSNRAMLTEMVDQDPTARSAMFVTAASDPAYLNAFRAVLKDPVRGHLMWSDAERESYARVEHMRAALSLTDGNGGYLVPLTLDATAMIQNAGSTNPFRRIARIETTATDDWNGAKTAGVTAEWLAEGATAADASPTFTRATIKPHKLSAYVFGSYEILQDSNFVDQLPRLLADSFSNAEAAAFATGAGDGSNQPWGVVTRVAAVTTSRVAATTASAFGLPDIYKVHNALTARSRTSSSAAWVANNTIINLIRQMDTSGSAAFWTDLNGATPATLLGAPIYEASAMSAAVTTGSNVLLAGAFEELAIVDRIGTTLVYLNSIADTSSGRPTGSAGWFAFKRVGADVLNADSFRCLQL
jgi:HK97 family phage major capsid protein